MQKSEFRKYSTFIQIGLWCVFFMINFTENIPHSPVVDTIVYSLNYSWMIIGIVYVHYYLLLPFYLKSRRIVYFGLTIGVILSFLFLYYFIDYNLPFEDAFTYEDLDWQYFLYDFLLIILMVAVSSLYYFIEQWYYNLQKENSLKTEKLQAELNFLKSQINPHFLFNTLNNIYAFAQTGSQKTAPMLERLSSILRFMVYECSEEKVELKKELDAVDDLLEIYKMKNSEQQNVKMTIAGVKRFHLIAPLIIVNLVENAFKHSDAVSNPDGFIKINIEVDEADNCLCQISNSIKNKVVSNSPYQGVGLENVTKRLDLQYENLYSIKTQKKENQYHLNLKIPLERKL